MPDASQDSPQNSTINVYQCAEMDTFCDALFAQSSSLDSPDDWPGDQLTECGHSGVFRWFVPKAFGGEGWSDSDIVRGHLRLSAACLTTTFVLTQLTGALRRIVASQNSELRARLLPELLSGESIATLGISHLTTSGQHKKQPALTATETNNGFVLNGFSPWVTGAKYAQYLVIGASLEDGRQLMTVVPADAEGVEFVQPAELVALSASQTGAVKFNETFVSRDWLLAGPVEGVMKQGIGGATGGLQTSTLALGLATAAVDFIREESRQRPELAGAVDQLRADVDSSIEELLALADGTAEDTVSAGSLRVKSNSLVLRATQAALVAAKGRGYVVGHPAGRWCQQALFFLVWSCPQPVLAANLCELAGIE